MNKQEQNRTIHRVISVFGAKNQKMQTIEELIELQKEIFENVHRETNNRQNILEEVTDVEIMLTQLKEIYGFDDKQIEDMKDYKLSRLNRTIDKYLKSKQEDQNVESNNKDIHILRKISNEGKE